MYIQYANHKNGATNQLFSKGLVTKLCPKGEKPVTGEVVPARMSGRDRYDGKSRLR